MPIAHERVVCRHPRSAHRASVSYAERSAAIARGVYTNKRRANMHLLRAQKAGTLLRSALLALAGITVPVLAQAQGTITGRITSAATSEPLSDVRIAVVGSPIAVLSGADGRYTLRGVPAGTPEVRV